jgi:hypothetical protein
MLLLQPLQLGRQVTWQQPSWEKWQIDTLLLLQLLCSCCCSSWSVLLLTSQPPRWGQRHVVSWLLLLLC